MRLLVATLLLIAVSPKLFAKSTSELCGSVKTVSVVMDSPTNDGMFAKIEWLNGSSSEQRIDSDLPGSKLLLLAYQTQSVVCLTEEGRTRTYIIKKDPPSTH